MQFEPSRLTNYDRTAILAEMVRVANHFFDGQAPSHEEFNRHSRVHSATVVKEFDSWEAAWRTAGMEYVRSPVKTKAIVADLQRILETSGGYFSFRFYKENGGRYSCATIRKRFGNSAWAEVLTKTLGLQPKPRTVAQGAPPKIASRPHSQGVDRGEMRCTAEHLLAELRCMGEKAKNGLLTYQDYRRVGGKYSITTFQKYFGKWRNALKCVGLKGGDQKQRVGQQHFADEDYFRELQRVWEILGRQPKASEMKANGSLMSPQAFQVRFGSWLRAIHAFCRDRNGPDTDVDAGSSGEVSETATVEGNQTSGCAIDGSRPANDSMVGKRTPRKPSLRLRFKVLIRDRSTCQVCGRSPTHDPGVRLEWDHIVPYSRGGETVLENLRLLCWECNSGKSDLPAGGMDKS